MAWVENRRPREWINRDILAVVKSQTNVQFRVYWLPDKNIRSVRLGNKTHEACRIVSNDQYLELNSIACVQHVRENVDAILDIVVVVKTDENKAVMLQPISTPQQSYQVGEG